MAKDTRTVTGKVVQGTIMGDPKKVTQIYANSSTAAETPSTGEKSETVPKYVWISALVFTSALLIFMMAAFFITRTLTEDQRNMLHLLYSLLAGFSAMFLGGSVLLNLEMSVGDKGKMGIAAAAGIAVFIFVWLTEPFWLR